MGTGLDGGCPTYMSWDILLSHTRTWASEASTNMSSLSFSDWILLNIWIHLASFILSMRKTQKQRLELPWNDIPLPHKSSISRSRESYPCWMCMPITRHVRFLQHGKGNISLFFGRPSSKVWDHLTRIEKATRQEPTNPKHR